MHKRSPLRSVIPFPATAYTSPVASSWCGLGLTTCNRVSLKIRLQALLAVVDEEGERSQEQEGDRIEMQGLQSVQLRKHLFLGCG